MEYSGMLKREQEKVTANRQKILIADDSELNRSILSDILTDSFDIIEACDGVQAVEMLQKYEGNISLLLLDIVMPELDGFGVLAMMNRRRWIEYTPVVMISAENSQVYVDQAYELGVVDFIRRPFDAKMVYRRVINTIMLYTKQKKLVGLVADQIYEREKSNSMMVAILSHIVEFRNGESGLHAMHVSVITGILAERLIKKTERYGMKAEDVSLLCMVSALHDIGKIGIPEKILNKPGKLTKEEFDVMKTHCILGADMLEEVPFDKEELLIKMAYEVCRWHHERYDGKGYPDGLKGDEIPITAQLVSMADVYDALTSERVYKKAFSHEKAIRVILNGECGCFNPLLLECLADTQEKIRKELKINSLSFQNYKEMRRIVDDMLCQEGISASDRTVSLLEHERMKFHFFESLSKEILFEYFLSPPMLTLSEWGAQRLGMEENVMAPGQNERFLKVMEEADIQEIVQRVRTSTPENPIVNFECKFTLNGEERWHRIICRVMWTEEEPFTYSSVIGKAVDIHEEHLLMEDLI